MSNPPSERLYRLLPAIYRQHDQTGGQPLRALLALIEQDFAALEQAIGGLYENWFIETCDDWAVPYLGDLLGVEGLGAERSVSHRAYVANALSYRRRKGVAQVIEQVARAVSGWSVRAVEHFELLGRAQHLHHVRPGSGQSVDLRRRDALAALGGPFESTARRVDVRRIASGRGRHNVGNVGLFVWRLHSLPMHEARACPVPGQPGCYTLHPLGFDQPLFSRPATPSDERRLGPEHLPLPLRRPQTPGGLVRHLGPDNDIQLFARASNGALRPIPPEQVVSADLSAWARPTTAPLALDLERGRLALAGEATPEIVASYRYGDAGLLGGGPYDRRATLDDPREATWVVEVEAGGTVPSLAAALEGWRRHCAITERPRGLIRLLHVGAYTLDPAEPIEVPAGGRLAVEAADGIVPTVDAGAALTVRGEGRDAALRLGGLLLAGTLRLGGGLRLGLDHCTLPAGLAAEADAEQATVALASCIVGPLRLAGGVAELAAADSIIDAAPGSAEFEAGFALAADEAGAPGPRTTLRRVTVLGASAVRELVEASDCIFAGPLRVLRHQEGMVRYCYLPPGSVTPRRYRCQPEEGGPEPLLRFQATRYGEPGYAGLAPDCPRTIAAGAESGAELGAYHNLAQPQREANLRAMIGEHLPLGMEAGIFFMS